MKVVALALVAGCTSFEDPSIVLDLRVIGMTANPPEQVLDVDIAKPNLADVVAQLQPSAICATLADPGRARALRWSMTACFQDNARCDPTRAQLPLESGTVDDPDTTSDTFCVLLAPDAGLVDVLTDAFETDPVHGLGGLDYGIELAVGGVDDDPANDQFAFKDLRVSARIPVARTPNQNPQLAQLTTSLDNGVADVLVPQGCTSAFASPMAVRTGDQVTIFPMETATTREMYFAPTIDGTFEVITETLRYQWLATAGEFSDDFTGGPPDLAGNLPLLGSEWTAPAVRGPTLVPIWVIQRDERYGATTYEACMRVIP